MNTVRIVLALSLMLAFGCADSDESTSGDIYGDLITRDTRDTSTTITDTGVADTGVRDTGVADTGVKDTGTTTDGTKDVEADGSGKKAFGEECEENSDCEDGYCVPSDIGYICTRVCIDDCPESWVCKGVTGFGSDLVFVCLPSEAMICEKKPECDSGTQEEEPCGNCGKRTRTCGMNCRWSDWSDCFGEGSCKIGEKDTQSCGMCGTQQKVCQEDCTWSDWGECTGEGMCAAGDNEVLACDKCGSKVRECTSQCFWSDWGPCEGMLDCEPQAKEEEECGNCGIRERVCGDDCSWGDWGDCDEGAGACQEGAKEYRDCGDCGWQERECTGTCEWTTWSPCEEEGECLPDDDQTIDCGYCGMQAQVCKTTCTEQLGEDNYCRRECKWDDVGGCLMEGECPKNTEEDCDICGTRECSSECEWSICDVTDPGPAPEKEDLDMSDPTDPYHKTDTRDTAVYLGSKDDSDGFTYLSVPHNKPELDGSQWDQPNINPLDDADWFRIRFDDHWPAVFEPHVHIDPPDGHKYSVHIEVRCDYGDHNTRVTDHECEGSCMYKDSNAFIEDCKGDSDERQTVYIRIQAISIDQNPCETYRFGFSGDPP